MASREPAICDLLEKRIANVSMTNREWYRRGLGLNLIGLIGVVAAAGQVVARADLVEYLAGAVFAFAALLIFGLYAQRSQIRGMEKMAWNVEIAPGDERLVKVILSLPVAFSVFGIVVVGLAPELVRKVLWLLPFFGTQIGMYTAGLWCHRE